MNGRPIVLVACAVVVTTILNSCGGGQLITGVPDRPLSVIFAGFSYVGQFAGRTNQDLPLHGLQGLPLPGEIKPGVLYVFHYPVEKGDSLSPLEILPGRLRSLGFEAPEPTSIISLSSGGPLYEIKFWHGHCTGSIRHEVDKVLSNSRWPWDKRWEPDDTTLSVSAGCDL